jgi:hypothetical protein
MIIWIDFVFCTVYLSLSEVYFLQWLEYWILDLIIWSFACNQFLLILYTHMYACIFVCVVLLDRICGLLVRVPGYIPRGPGFHSRRCRIFWEVVGLECGPLSIVRIIEEIHEWKISSSGLENRYQRPSRPVALTMRHPSTLKVGTNFVHKRRLLDPYSSLRD